MINSFQLHAVVETFADRDDFHPWEVSATIKPYSFLRIWESMTYQEIGVFMAQIVQYNRIDRSDSTKQILQKIIEAKGLVLPGGLQAIDIDREEVIQPSCCCSLEGWREWYNFLESGQSPWLGHDPSPWIEFRGDMIRIWSDGGLDGAVKNASYIDVTRSDYIQAMNFVARDLQAFSFCIDSWAQEIGFEHSQELARQIDRCFNVNTPQFHS